METPMGVNLRASAYLHQGDRKYMEDEFQVAYQKSADNKNIEHAFFGIFDGHGGKDAAQFAKDNLMDNIISQRAFWSDEDEDVLNAIREGFLQTHHAMWKVLDQWPRTGSGWPSTSGTTASIAFIRKQKLYIGHVGDSGIVLGYENGKPGGKWIGESLTQDHKPESAPEMTRIKESGGKVVYKSGVPRVVWNRPKSGHQGPVRRSTPMDEIPFLAVARSLGDLWSYNPNNDEFIVSPEPDVYAIDLDVTRHRCLIFGTDGLWNALTPQCAVNIAYFIEKNNDKHHLGIKLPCGKERLWINPSRSIVAGALECYHRMLLRADNTSAVTVFLDPVGKAKREILLQQAASRDETVSVNSSPEKQASVQMNFYNSPGSSDRLYSNYLNEDNLPNVSKFMNTSVNPDSDSANLPTTSNIKNPVVVEDVYGNNEPYSDCSTASDIQIPEVSSSTSLDIVKNRAPVKRTTRSITEKNVENKSQRWRPSVLKRNGKTEEHSSRILRTMNRDSNCDKPIEKRKRSNLSPDCSDTESKRMSTRAHTLSSKSMVTRSQEKRLKAKTK